MYKEDSVRQFLMDYKITITGSKNHRQYNIIDPYTAMDYKDYVSDNVRMIDVKLLTAEIPEYALTEIADILCEFRDLMKDPETAKLLMEARFINRLKGGR